MKFVYQVLINKIYRKALKPFSAILPNKYKIAVNGTFTVKSKSGIQFKMVTNPTNAVTKFLFWGGVEGFEYNSSRVFCEVINHASVFFDIGANIGYYSLLASSIRQKNIQVFAFEPMPSIYDFLIKNCEVNGFDNIRCFQLALSDAAGEATFYGVVNPKFEHLPQLTGDGGLSKDHSGKISKIQFQVNTMGLDAFVTANLPDKKIDFIKLDTEANEHRVLSAAHKVLSEHRPIIQCEILKNQIESEMQHILDRYGYLYYRAIDKGLMLVDSFSNNNSDFVDYYLVPKEKQNLVSKFVI